MTTYWKSLLLDSCRVNHSVTQGGSCVPSSWWTIVRSSILLAHLFRTVIESVGAGNVTDLSTQCICSGHTSLCHTHARVPFEYVQSFSNVFWKIAVGTPDAGAATKVSKTDGVIQWSKQCVWLTEVHTTSISAESRALSHLRLVYADHKSISQ